MAEVAVIAERDLAQEEVAGLVEAVALDQLQRRDHVAQGLRHLLALDRPPAVGEDALLGVLEAGAHQEGRPVDGVEAQDVLADDVQLGRPEPGPGGAAGVGVVDGRDVVGERVEPDIHHVRRIARDRDAPAEAGARDGEVLEPAADEADDLVAARGREHEVRVGLVEGEEPVLPGGEAEEVAGLLDPLDRRPGRRLAVHELALGVEGLVADRVPAGILAEIDVAGGDEPLPQGRHRPLVAGLGGADEVVVAVAHDAGELAEALRDLVGEGLRVDPAVTRGLLDLLAVLVGAGEEEDLVAVQALEAGQRVAGERGVGVADMG